jgi:coenzyme F420-reducing hydrogenase alpha subunit
MAPSRGHGRRISRTDFKDYLQYVQIRHSHGEGYRFSDTDGDYLVGALARLNLNQDALHTRTRADAEPYLSAFPSNNVYHNNLAQAIDLLRTTRMADEEPVRRPAQPGTVMGVIEAKPARDGLAEHDCLRVELPRFPVECSQQLVSYVRQSARNFPRSPFLLVDEYIRS